MLNLLSVPILREYAEQTKRKPRKRSHIGGQLSLEDKGFNRQLAQQRVISEHVNRSLKIFKHISTDEIVVGCNKPTQPLIVCPMGGLLNQLYLVMPVEIKQGFEKVNSQNQSTKTEVSTQSEPGTEEVTEVSTQTESSTEEVTNVAQATDDSETPQIETPSVVAKDTTKGKSTSRSPRTKKEAATA
jgi:DNA polymerase-3 subunit beta